MAAIVLGHSLRMSMTHVGFGNMEDILATPLSPNAAETQLSLGYFTYRMEVAVDNFFFISGFLLAITTKRRGAPIILGSILRYLRLTPSLAMMLLIQTCISPYIIFGPFAPRVQALTLRTCDHGWWPDLLYIMNFYPGDDAKMCAVWTWYLGNEFIFCIVGLILVNMWKCRRSAAWSSVLLILACSFAYSMTTIYQKHLGVYYQEQFEYVHYLYSKPLHRVPVFLIGMSLPWVLDALQRRGLDRSPNVRKSWAAKLVWTGLTTIAGVVMLICILLPETNFRGWLWQFAQGDELVKD